MSNGKLVSKTEYLDFQKSMSDKLDKLGDKIDCLENKLLGKISQVEIKMAGFSQDIFDRADRRYASKEVEIWIKRGMITIIGVVGLAVLYLIINIEKN